MAMRQGKPLLAWQRHQRPAEEQQQQLKQHSWHKVQQHNPQENFSQVTQRPWMLEQEPKCTYTLRAQYQKHQVDSYGPWEEGNSPRPWETQAGEQTADWPQLSRQQQLEQQWHEQQRLYTKPDTNPSFFSQQQQQQERSPICVQSTRNPEWQEQQQQEEEGSEFHESQQQPRQPHAPWQRFEVRWRLNAQQQQQQQQDEGPHDEQQVVIAVSKPRSKRVWGAEHATVAAAATTSADAGSTWRKPQAWPLSGLRGRAFTRGDDNSSSSNSSSKQQGLSFEGVTAATAAAAVAEAVLQSAAQQTPTVLLPTPLDTQLPGPAGRWLRRKQQQEKGKKNRWMQRGDSPFASGKEHKRSADSSQSSFAAVAVAAAASVPGFTPTPGCWGGAWLGLNHYHTAGAAASAATAALYEQKLPLEFSASWARALLFLGLPFDAFHLGLTASLSPCPRIMSFLVESNVAAVLRSSDSPVRKVPHLLLFLTHAVMGDHEGGLTDRVFFAADPTGVLACSVHSSVSESQHLCPGSTVILQQATVYYAAFKLPYVLITQRSLVRAFSPTFIDDALRQQADDARYEWEYRWRGVHEENAEDAHMGLALTASG